MSDFSLVIVTPEKKLLEVNCLQANLPGSEGVFGVLAGHMNLISSLDPGIIEYFEPNSQKSHKIAISDGFAEVSSDACVVIVEHACIENHLTPQELDAKITSLEAKVSSVDSSVEALKMHRELQYYKAIKKL